MTLKILFNKNIYDINFIRIEYKRILLKKE